jgi:hypothetical protein
LSSQYVEDIKKKSTNIQADTPKAKFEYQRGDRNVTKPKRRPEKESSKPQPSTVKLRDGIDLTSCTYAKTQQASEDDEVASRFARALENR